MTLILLSSLVEVPPKQPFITFWLQNHSVYSEVIKLVHNSPTTPISFHPNHPHQLRLYRGVLGSEDYQRRNTLRLNKSHPIWINGCFIFYSFYYLIVTSLIQYILTLEVERFSERSDNRNHFVDGMNTPSTDISSGTSFLDFFRRPVVDQSLIPELFDLRRLLVTHLYLRLGRGQLGSLLWHQDWLWK